MKILIIVLICIVADFITGIVGALISGGFQSSKMRTGILHKVCEIMIMFLGYFCEWAFPQVGIDVSIPVVTTIAVYLILMETASVLENLKKFNPALAGTISKAFPFLGGTNDERDN